MTMQSKLVCIANTRVDVHEVVAVNFTSEPVCKRCHFHIMEKFRLVLITNTFRWILIVLSLPLTLQTSNEVKRIAHITQ